MIIRLAISANLKVWLKGEIIWIIIRVNSKKIISIWPYIAIPICHVANFLWRIYLVYLPMVWGFCHLVLIIWRYWWVVNLGLFWCRLYLYIFCDSLGNLLIVSRWLRLIWSSIGTSWGIIMFLCIWKLWINLAKVNMSRLTTSNL